MLSSSGLDQPPLRPYLVPIARQRARESARRPPEIRVLPAQDRHAAAETQCLREQGSEGSTLCGKGVDQDKLTGVWHGIAMVESIGTHNTLFNIPSKSMS